MSPDPLPAAAPSSSSGAARAGGAGPAAVLWDLDGTVVDTEPFWDRANAELVAAHGGRWTRDDALAVVGSDLLDAAAYVRRECGVDLDPVEIVTTVIARVAEQMAGATPWQPGVLALLAELRAAAVPSVLVTMSWRPLVDRVVGLLPPGTFAATVAGDEVPRGKPHPDPYLAAAAAVGVEPSSCLAIEDSPTGIASARAAGCFVVGVPHLVDLRAADVDALVPTLDGVDLTTLRRLFAR